MAKSVPVAKLDEYFRRDQKSGVTPPELLNVCTFAEHIVHARGKRTQYTSITLDPGKCHDFGEQTYRLKRPEVDDAGHVVIEHLMLLAALQKAAKNEQKAERIRAIQALRYARRRQEGLVDWKIKADGIERKKLSNFVEGQIRKFFVKA